MLWGETPLEQSLSLALFCWECMCAAFVMGPGRAPAALRAQITDAVVDTLERCVVKFARVAFCINHPGEAAMAANDDDLDMVAKGYLAGHSGEAPSAEMVCDACFMHGFRVGRAERLNKPIPASVSRARLEVLRSAGREV